MASGASGKRLHLMFKYVHDCKDNVGKSNVVDKQQTEQQRERVEKKLQLTAFVPHVLVFMTGPRKLS